ncbi:MAG: CpsD/CapB family tyrosine-protein kinase [candidate division Zixibacteria bacterium]|nr:CpsD/CapB family tyrosine-protein kinase [candidate division Zixibacteria bacterium]
MSHRPLSILDFYSPEVPFATEFRRLLQRIESNSKKFEHKAILITSAELAEGKSTICSFLALSAARQKKMKTLLIDADIRRPSIHKFFSMQREGGLTEILSGNLNAAEAVKHTDIEQLHIITAGKHNQQPSDFFDAEAIGRLISEMKFYYDMVLVDCAPVLPVSDPMLLASKLDSIILVIKAGKTQKEVVERAINILGSNSNSILGVVLNNMNNSLPYYYDYKYYGYNSETDGPRDKRKNQQTSKDSKRNHLPHSDNNSTLNNNATKSSS